MCWWSWSKYWKRKCSTKKLHLSEWWACNKDPGRFRQSRMYPLISVSMLNIMINKIISWSSSLSAVKYINICSLELKESETPRIQLPVILTPDYWIVCKHALNQQQCGDICILRAHISFLAKMIEFQVLKYSVLWIPHPVRAAEKFYFQCHFSLNFSPRNSISNKTIWKRDEIVHFYFVQIPL